MARGPGRSAKRLPRFVWIVPALVLAATAVWWLARAPSEKDARRRAVAAASARNAEFSELFAKLRLEPDPMAFVQARAGREDAVAITDLIQAYAAWASRGDALEARRQIIKQFIENPDIKVGMEALLRAVALDMTPRRQDPLWRDLVSGVSRQWNAMSISWGRDLVQTETNPKTKDLLLESLAEVDPHKIGPEQQNLLVTDLIDLYPYASPDQKPALDRALAAMAGPDVVEILSRRGINEGSTPIASIEKINQEIEATRGKYKKVLEQIEAEDREAKETNAREAAKSKN
jgi:hypothetical protein